MSATEGTLRDVARSLASIDRTLKRIQQTIAPVEDVAVGEAASGVCGCGAEHSGTSSQAGLATFQGL